MSGWVQFTILHLICLSPPPPYNNKSSAILLAESVLSCAHLHKWFADWTRADDLPVHLARLPGEEGAVRRHRGPREGAAPEEGGPCKQGGGWPWGGVLLHRDWHPPADLPADQQGGLQKARALPSRGAGGIGHFTECPSSTIALRPHGHGATASRKPRVRRSASGGDEPHLCHDNLSRDNPMEGCWPRGSGGRPTAAAAAAGACGSHCDPHHHIHNCHQPAGQLLPNPASPDALLAVARQIHSPFPQALQHLPEVTPEEASRWPKEVSKGLWYGASGTVVHPMQVEKGTTSHIERLPTNCIICSFFSGLH